MSKEIILDHNDIRSGESCTQATKNAMAALGCDIHKHEVTDIQDDHKTGKRKLTVKNTKYHTIGNVPWHKG